MSRVLVLVTFCCVLSTTVRSEQLFKPMAQNTGATANGLQASLTFVKADFGPGESLLAALKITNISDKPASFKVNRGTWYDVSIHIRRNGEALKLSRSMDRKDMDFKSSVFSLESGAEKSLLMDLRSIDWDEPKWCDTLGTYEVQIALGEMQTAWTRFRITAPGERIPELAPEQAEKLRGWITQLGDGDFTQRERAHSAIRALGKAAVPMLQEAGARERDTEIVTRCNRLIQEITQPRRLPPPLPVPPVIVRPQPRPVPQPPLPPPDLEF